MMICKKKILSAMVLMGTASTLMAQTTVKGRVTDQNGEPVIGATVSLNGQTKSLSVTDVNGSAPNAAKLATARATISLHGVWNPYDSHIPLLFYGWHIDKGRSSESVQVKPFKNAQK